MKRVALKRKTPLKAGKGLSPVSKRRREQLYAELEDRALLCQRAGGIFCAGKDSRGNMRYICHLGKCELCGKPPDGLSDYCLYPAEVKPRSQGGKVSVTNSLMACLRPTCHNHDRYRHGLPMTDEDALVLIGKLNKEKLGLEP